ncbi:RNA polymerase sigma factor [Pedobacter sp. Hv1]|uniref:RNA polymerase sigma factor n=1 Tax=Pedobacter sp. Hv1 TaxID=1740090 RepID=UPI0006D89FBB|nr:sigma-70 family RNA polymerase sigma factor [Pedobacter sp. Hv1]KQC00069.1 hypothetical protein AQF98_13970 [Pedobacter sp. Hv1]
MNLKAIPTATPEQHWHALKNDDGQALEKLYHLYANMLYNYGTKFSADQDLIRECIQLLFVTLWTRRNHLGQPKNVKNYLFKAFRLSIFKKAKLLQRHESYEEVEHYHFQASISIEEELIIGEDHIALQQRIQASLDQLSSRQREVIFLKFYEGLSYPEIAEVMGISVKGSYKLIARAIESLRDKMDNRDFPLLLLLLSLKFFN